MFFWGVEQHINNKTEIQTKTETHFFNSFRTCYYRTSLIGKKGEHVDVEKNMVLLRVNKTKSVTLELIILYRKTL